MKWKRRFLKFSWIPSLFLFLLLPGSAHAQGETIVNEPLTLMLIMAALSLAPFVLIMGTSFVKISVVLSILRNAMGTQQIPPTQVINGLSIILTIYIMYPVALQIKQAAQPVIDERTGKPLVSDATADLLKSFAEKAKEPMKNFLLKHTHAQDRVLFFGLAKKMRPPDVQEDITDKDFLVVVPAFVISELKEAFQIGFLLFVPFIVIDMVVSNILLAMGMQMLSPVTISLPFKLLLFILIDGWYLLARGLVMGYL